MYVLAKEYSWVKPRPLGMRFEDPSGEALFDLDLLFSLILSDLLTSFFGLTLGLLHLFPSWLSARLPSLVVSFALDAFSSFPILMLYLSNALLTASSFSSPHSIIRTGTLG